ncbi:MAG TPA: lactate utilization protein [Terriglobia bacterium]|nr:lactate utilization protein [Terriglobia bacterium]
MTRGKMLQEVRAALKSTANDTRTPGKGYFGPLPELGQVMPELKSSDLVSIFESELQKLAGSTHRASTLSDLDSTLRGILESSSARAVVLSRNPLLAQLGLESRLRSWGIEVSLWPADAQAVPSDQGVPFRAACFSAQVGITGVDYVLAESGSLIVTSQTEGCQLVSLAPPVHVALYRRSQILGSLEEVLDRLAGDGNSAVPTPGRSIVFISGTSRTADIEQILIRGVHGPGQVHAILVEDACFS